MRKFLTTSDIARLCGRTRAQVWNWAKAGLIEAQTGARRVNGSGKQIRYIDSPELREWCEAKRNREDPVDFATTLSGHSPRKSYYLPRGGRGRLKLPITCGFFGPNHLPVVLEY